MNFSGKFYSIVAYGVRQRHRAHRPRPGARPGAAASPEADHRRRLGLSARDRLQAVPRDRATRSGATLMADIAHPAGLVAAGLHPSPVPLADFVTTTTHKTLRGPRGGMVMCRAAYAKALDKTVLPGMQGGPLMHVIAAKAVAFREALTPEWRAYQRADRDQRARRSPRRCWRAGYRLVSGGTDTHLMLVDLTRPEHHRQGRAGGARPRLDHRQQEHASRSRPRARWSRAGSASARRRSPRGA